MLKLELQLKVTTTVKPVLNGHLKIPNKLSVKDRDLLNRGVWTLQKYYKSTLLSVRIRQVSSQYRYYGHCRNTLQVSSPKRVLSTQVLPVVIFHTHIFILFSTELWYSKTSHLSYANKKISWITFPTALWFWKIKKKKNKKNTKKKTEQKIQVTTELMVFPCCDRRKKMH